MDKNRTRVSLLQFANNINFFSRSSMVDLKNLKLISLFFKQISRFKVNLDKSRIQVGLDA